MYTYVPFQQMVSETDWEVLRHRPEYFVQYALPARRPSVMLSALRRLRRGRLAAVRLSAPAPAGADKRTALNVEHGRAHAAGFGVSCTR